MLNKKVIIGRIERQEEEMANSLMEIKLQNRSTEELKSSASFTGPKPTPRVYSLVEEMKKRQKKWGQRTDKLAVKSKSRIDTWV